MAFGVIPSNPGSGPDVAVDIVTGRGACQLIKILSATEGSAQGLTINSQGKALAEVTGTVGITGTVTVAGTVTSTTTSVNPGTAAANLGKAEDAVHANGDVGVMLLGVRNDAGSAFTNTDGDYSPLRVNSAGELVVRARGQQAHDNPIDNAPVAIAFEARTANRAAVANGDVVQSAGDIFGRQINLLNSPRSARVYGKNNLTNDTPALLIAAPGAGKKIVVTSVRVVNAHATIGTKVELLSASTVKDLSWARIDGGGWSDTDDMGLFECTENEALNARCTVNGANVDIRVSGFVEG